MLTRSPRTPHVRWRPTHQVCAGGAPFPAGAAPLCAGPPLVPSAPAPQPVRRTDGASGGRGAPPADPPPLAAGAAPPRGPAAETRRHRQHRAADGEGDSRQPPPSAPHGSVVVTTAFNISDITSLSFNAIPQFLKLTPTKRDRLLKRITPDTSTIYKYISLGVYVTYNSPLTPLTTPIVWICCRDPHLPRTGGAASRGGQLAATALLRLPAPAPAPLPVAGAAPAPSAAGARLSKWLDVTNRGNI